MTCEGGKPPEQRKCHPPEAKLGGSAEPGKEEQEVEEEFGQPSRKKAKVRGTYNEGIGKEEKVWFKMEGVSGTVADTGVEQTMVGG